MRTSLAKLFFGITALLAVLALPSPSWADQAWSEAFPEISGDVRAGRPLVTVVVVPLCSNAQIDCGSSVAGRPGDLRTNLYWGAVFGAKRFFDRKTSGWQQVEASSS